MNTIEPLSYPFGGLRFLDPRPETVGMADDEPLVRVRLPYGGDAWLARRYVDVKAVLVDTRFSKAAAFGKDVPRATPFINTTYQTLLEMDAPEHTRVRGLLGKAFKARHVETLRPRSEQVCDRLVSGMIADDPPCDLMDGLAWPFPISVICEMLDVPFEDRHLFRDWIDTMLAFTAFTPREVAEAGGQFQNYVLGMVKQRRRQPSDDLISTLTQARDGDTEQLGDDEIAQISASLLAGGHETTASQIGNFVYNLLTHPDQLAKLRADPSLTDRAVEELMRYTPMTDTVAFPRIATEDLEIGGVLIKAGDAVFVDPVAANRDPRVFDNPDELDVTRENNQHVAFGHGEHYCLGAQLARMELGIVLRALLRRLPDLALAVPADQVRWRLGRLIRGPEELPVTWSTVLD